MRDLLLKLERGVVAFESVGIFTTLAVMVIALTVQIIARLGLPFDLDWTEEVSRIGLIWLIGLGAALATYRGEHFLVEFVLNALGESVRGALLKVLRTITLAFAAVMAWLGINSTIFNWGQIFPVLEIPVGIGYLAVAVGFGLMALHMAIGLVTGRRVMIEQDHVALGTGAD